MGFDYCIHHFSVVQNSFTVLKILCTLPIHPFLPLTPGNHWFFNFSTVLPLLEWHIVGIVQYIAFSDWLLSLNNMLLRFLPVFSWLDSLFLLLLNNIPWSGCTTVYLSIHLLKAFWLLPSFGNYEESDYKYPCTGFCVHVCLQLLWVNTKECCCWIIC